MTFNIVMHSTSDIVLLADDPLESCPTSLSLSYAQYSNLNDVVSTGSFAKSILNAQGECSAELSRDLGDSILAAIPSMFALYTYEDSDVTVKDVCLLTPSLIISDSILSKYTSIVSPHQWGTIRAEQVESLKVWLTNVANFFRYSQGFFSA